MDIIHKGLQKVEFVREKNYLQKLANLVTTSEVERNGLQGKANRLTIVEEENARLKRHIADLESQIEGHYQTQTQLEQELRLQDMKVKEFTKDNNELLARLKEQTELNTELETQVKSAKIENHSLFACIDELRKQIMEFKKPEVKS